MGRLCLSREHVDGVELEGVPVGQGLGEVEYVGGDIVGGVVSTRVDGPRVEQLGHAPDPT